MKSDDTSGPDTSVPDTSGPDSEGGGSSGGDGGARAAPAPVDSAVASGPVPVVDAAPVPLFAFGPWLWAMVAVLLLVVLALTGGGLLLFYRPTPAASLRSLVDLEQASSFGFLRDLHHWAAHGVLVAAWLHLARVFVVGSYRRRLGWRVTLLLVALVTLEVYLGDFLARPAGSGDALLAVYAAHVVAVPLVAVALVVAWRRLRAARHDEPDVEEEG